MSDRAPAEVRAQLERVLLRGLRAAGADPAETAGLADLAVRAAAAGGGPSAPGDPPVLDPRGAAALLLQLGRAERAAIEPPRMEPGDEATTTIDRLDAAMRAIPESLPRAPGEPDPAEHPARRAERRAAEMTSPDDLVRLATGGTLFESRAAVMRLDRFLRGDRGGFSVADPRAVAEALEMRLEGDLGPEIDDVLVALPGGPGGRARARRGRAQRIVEKFDRDVRRFWDGEEPVDPLPALDDEALATLGTYISDASDPVAGHVAETLRRLLIERSGDSLERIVSALALCGDERLVPALVRVLQDGTPAARMHAARALAPIDDPRVPAALRKAFRHAATVEETLVIGGVAAAHGDRVGAAAVAGHVSADQPPHLVELALLAMAHVGEPPHAALVAPFLESGRTGVARAAAVALGAFGDAAAIAPLANAAARPEMRPHVERALSRIRARLDLAGHHGAGPSTLAPPSSGEIARRPRTRLAARTLGRWHYALGVLWLLLGRRRAALRRFDLAHEHNPYLVGPLLARARIALRERRLDAAVTALRAALRVAASTVLQRPDRANLVIRVYLRHADAGVAAGQASRALEALDELLGYDLRFADVDLRLDIERRRDAVARIERGGVTP